MPTVDTLDIERRCILFGESFPADTLYPCCVKIPPEPQQLRGHRWNDPSRGKGLIIRERKTKQLRDVGDTVVITEPANSPSPAGG